MLVKFFNLSFYSFLNLIQNLFRSLYKASLHLASPPQSVPPRSVSEQSVPSTKRPLYKASPATKCLRNKASQFDQNIVVKINMKIILSN